MLSKHGLALAGLSLFTSSLRFTSAQSQYGDQYWHERYHGQSHIIVNMDAQQKSRVS